MPTPPYAQVQASVNAGAQQLGGQAGGVVVNAGDSVQLSPTSTVGWTTSPLWEIYSFPTGWAGPGGTWTFNSGANSWQNTNITPSAIVMPAVALWGDFLVRLTANGGIGPTPAVTQNLVDASLGLSMSASKGFVDVAYLEGTQFDQIRGYIGRLQATLRTLNAILPLGMATSAMADAPYTVPATEYQSAWLNFTQALTADRTATMPLPASNAVAYEKTISNNTSGAHNLIFTHGVGATVTIAAGKSARLGFNTANVIRITPDT